MNFVGALILFVLVVVVLTGSRKVAALGMMAGALYLTQAQAMNVAGINMFAVRFLELIGFMRVMSRGEFSFSRTNKIDKALTCLYVFMAIVYCLRSVEGGQAYVIGMAVDALLTFFIFRGLIRNVEELQSFLRSFLVLLVPYALLALLESRTHHNPFSIIGGGGYDWSREGRFRCVGSFRNPDLLGTLGASFAPLYIGLACKRAERKLAILGIGSCLLIVWASNSGGPLCATAVGMLGWGFWYLRHRMQLVRRVMAIGIIMLAMAMKAPIWYLLARASDITGGDGWHRSYLLDITFQHLRQWWLMGMSMSLTADWFPDGVLTTTGGADITNQFVSFGLEAGLGAIFLFILLLKRGFGSLGSAMQATRTAPEPDAGEFLLWGLGVMLAVHIANWMGITYFDQIYVVWFMQLAAVSTISASCTEAALSHEREAGIVAEEPDNLVPEMQVGQKSTP